MSGHSGLVQRIREAYSNGLQAGQETGYQRAFDYMSVAMRDAGMSGAKIKALLRAAEALDREIGAAWEPRSDVEADYYQEKLDERLREIFDEDFVPFAKRYPWIREVRY